MAGFFICFFGEMLFIIFHNKIKRLLPIFYIAEKFDEIVKERSNDLRHKQNRQ